MKQPYARGLALTVVAFLAGCGADNGPPLVPVSGVLTLDGRPLASKTVHFIPEDGTPGVGAGATTNSEGRYTLIAARPGAVVDTMGVPPGNYRVIVVEPMFPIDLPAAQSESDEPAAATGLPDMRKRPRTTIPAQYMTVESTPFRLKVAPEGGAIDLQLVSRGK